MMALLLHARLVLGQCRCLISGHKFSQALALSLDFTAEL